MEKESASRLPDRDTLDSLRGRGRQTFFSDWEVVLRQIEMGEAFCVIESGKAAVRVASSAKGRMEPGILEPSRHLASAMAVEYT